MSEDKNFDINKIGDYEEEILSQVAFEWHSSCEEYEKKRLDKKYGYEITLLGLDIDDLVDEVIGDSDDDREYAYDFIDYFNVGRKWSSPLIQQYRDSHQAEAEDLSDEDLSDFDIYCGLFHDDPRIEKDIYHYVYEFCDIGSFEDMDENVSDTIKDGLLSRITELTGADYIPFIDFGYDTLLQAAKNEDTAKAFVDKYHRPNW